jgi:tetratricopeptide (TPR) repeat protein
VALVVLAFGCAPERLAPPDAAQSTAPSGTDEGALPKDSRLLQQCFQKYLIAERNSVNLNLKELTPEGVFRLSTLSNLARSYFILGELEQTDVRRQYFEKGRYFSELLCREHPTRVEGHYWLALNLCGLCDFIGAGRALLLVPKIVEHLETALSLDQTYDQAGPHRVLGRIRFKAPIWPLSEGDPIAAVQHLRSAAEIAPDNSTNHLYLAEALLEQGNGPEACRELERAISSTQHAVSPCGLDQDRAEAFRLMDRCNQ